MAAELRFVVTGDVDVKRAISEIKAQARAVRQELVATAKDGAKQLNKELAEVRKEAGRLEQFLKAADAEAKRGLTVTISQARRLFQACGSDVNVFKAALTQAGVKTFDIKVLTQQITREFKESRREAMGLDGNMQRLRDSIKAGTFQAQAMQAAFERGKAALEAMQRLGKVKGLEDSTKDAIELQDKFDTLQEKLNLVKDPALFAQVRKNIRDISIYTNVPQGQLIDATLKAQEAQSAGRELALDDGGALLRQLAAAAYGDRSDNIPESIKTSVDLMKSLKITGAKDLSTAQGIIRVGEEKGAITAKDIGSKGGMFISQLAELQGTQGHTALRRGAALFQTMGGAAGINGDFGEANTRLIDLLGKLVDPKTRDRLKEATGVDTMTKEGKLREIPDILAEVALTGAVPKTEADLAEAERDPKKKATFAKFFEVFREKESRQGFIGLLQGRSKIRDLENVDAQEGVAMLVEFFKHRVNAPMGKLDQIARRDEAVHFDKLGEKMPAITTAASIISSNQAQNPVLSSVAGMAGDVAGMVGGAKAKLAVEGGIAGLSVIAGSSAPNTRHEMVMKEEGTAIAAAKASIEKTKQETAALQAQIQELRAQLGGGSTVNVKVEVTEGLTARVTSDAKTSKGAARTGTRTAKPGQR